MKNQRAFILISLLMLVACASAAAWLDRSWFMGWRGNRAADFNPLRYAIGDGQKIFAGHFYRKADVYFHSGMYPSIFDNNESFKTAHIGEDAGATGSKNIGDEENFLGKQRDIIDRFSRNFFPSRHTHLDQGGASGHSHGGGEHHHGPDGQVIELGDGTSGEAREILPWLKVAQELDPENPLTYTVAAYWLRVRMNKTAEAELFVREGLNHLPDHPVLLFELGRVYFEPSEWRQSQQHRNPARARNLWVRGVRAWMEQEAKKTDPDKFILEQILTHLAKLEEEAGNLPLAISYWEQAGTLIPERKGIPERIAELKAKQSSLQPPR